MSCCFFASAQLPDELPGDLLSTPLVWVRWGGGSSHPFSRSSTAPTPSCAVGPAPSPSESGLRTRLLPSATSRLAWPQMPCLAAHVAAADCQVCTQSVVPQPSGCGELATSLLTVKPVGEYSTTLVQYLYISCYVTVNKPVLLYLLLRLLPQW
jgi:hypothetical protein